MRAVEKAVGLLHDDASGSMSRQDACSTMASLINKEAGNLFHHLPAWVMS